MIKNLVVVVSGGALAFGLAGTVSPAMAWASAAHPAGVARANLPMPEGTPIIRDSNAQLGHRGQVTIFNPPDPPVIRHSKASGQVGNLSAPPDTPVVRGSKSRPGGECVTLMAPPDPPTVRDSSARLGHGHPGHLRLWNPAAPPTIRDSLDQNAPPTIRDAGARTGGAECAKLTNPPGTPIIRDSNARFGDPDDGGQVQAFAALSDPDAGGQ